MIPWTKMIFHDNFWLASIVAILLIISNIETANTLAVSPLKSKLTSSKLRFIAIGDWGSDRDRQGEDAAAIGHWCAENECDFIISTGDNFYDEGVTSATDYRFDHTWRDVYTHSSIANLTWYICAGNHDHGDDDGR